MKKFQIMIISRYQDSLPVFHYVHAQESYMNETVAIELLNQYDNDMWPDEAKELMQNSKMIKSEKCWCIWGEEDDIIMSVIE